MGQEEPEKVAAVPVEKLVAVPIVATAAVQKVAAKDTRLLNATEDRAQIDLRSIPASNPQSIPVDRLEEDRGVRKLVASPLQEAANGNPRADVEADGATSAHSDRSRTLNAR